MHAHALHNIPPLSADTCGETAVVHPGGASLDRNIRCELTMHCAKRAAGGGAAGELYTTSLLTCATLVWCEARLATEPAVRHVAL